MFKSNPIYNDYGASEMKATYQRSMLKSNLIVILMVVLSVTVYQIVLAVSPPEVIVPPAPPDTENPWDVNPPPPIIPEDPNYGAGNAAENELVVGIPKPVDDSLEFDEVMIPTKVERSQLVDNRYPNAGEGEEGSFEYTYTDTGDHFPKIDEVVIVDKMPQMIHHKKPKYPRLIKQAGGEGEVIIRALIDKNGDVLKAVVYKGSSYELLDESALEAAFENKYSPAIKANEPVRIWVSYKVVFKLD